MNLLEWSNLKAWGDKGDSDKGYEGYEHDVWYT